MQVSGVCDKPLRQFYDMFGGSIGGPYTNNGNSRDFYKWQVSSRSGVLGFLDVLGPLLVVKSGQVKCLHEMYAFMEQNGRDSDIMPWYNKIRRLNRRGKK